MDIIYENFIDILSKRVPVDNISIRIESIVSKIKLVTLPDHIVEYDHVEKIYTEDEFGGRKEESL